MSALRSCLPWFIALVFLGCGNAGTSGGSGVPADAVTADGAAADGASTDAATSDIGAADTSSDAGPPDAKPDTAATACEATVVPCTDSQIPDMSLLKKASKRIVENEPDGAGFLSHVDATGGGMTPTESYVYARFTDTGLERVDIGDEAAFDKPTWDIAFRRYVIRLDSGVSGPSCVVGAALPAGTDYDSVTAAPAKLALESEAYYTKKCQLVPDGSGLNGPGTVLSGFWTYANCVQMSGAVYIVQLADGRQIKLTVTSFYPAAAQAKCDETGAAPPGTAGGQIRFRWAFLQP